MNRRAEGLPEVNRKSGSQTPEQKRASRKSVVIYIAMLFLVVIFFIVLSYFINVRNSSQIHTLHQKNMTAQQNIENLQNENVELKRKNIEYEMEIAEIEQQVIDLESELRETRKNWRDDVQAVITSGREQYNELLDQYCELKMNYDIKVGNND